MRFVSCVLLVALATGCGSAGVPSAESRYGISIAPLAGWNVEISRGLVRMARGDVSVELYEYEASSDREASVFAGPWPVKLEAREFGRRDDEQERLVSVSGRLFTVFGFGDPTSAELEDVNAMLETIDVAPGEFYPGSVAPVAMPERAGWHLASTGPTERRASGESAHTAAATIPYRDDPYALPPRLTLEALPDDGIVVWVGMSRDAHISSERIAPETAYERRGSPPYRLADLERVDGWEGQVRDIPDYRLWTAIGDRYLVDLRVYFGDGSPTPAMLAEADAVVRSLRFPDWGPWELDAS